MIDRLKRGVAAGGIAGVAYGAFTWLVVSPLVGGMEHLAAHAGDHGHGHDHAHAVSEAVTAVVSTGGGVLWGILLGAAFGVAYYLFEPALPGGDLRAYVLAGAGFLTVSVAPWTVLPPVAPGMEQLYGADVRVALYAGLMVVGALVATASVTAYGRLRDRGRPVALAAAAVPLAGLGLLAVLAPRTLLLGDAPADLVPAFQWLVAFGQAGLWALIAASFRRLDRGGRSPAVAADRPSAHPAD